MILSLLRTIGRAPLGLLHLAGTVCGWAAYALVAGFRRKTRQNLTTAGLYRPGLAWASAASAGQAAFETCYIWFRQPGLARRERTGLPGAGSLKLYRSVGNLCSVSWEPPDPQ